MPTFVRWNVVSVCMCVGGLLRSPSIGKRQVLPGRFGEGRRCAGVGRIISGSRTRRSTYSRTRDHHHHDDRQWWRWRRWRLPLASAAGPGDRPWSQSLPVWRPHCWNASSKIDSVATNASDGDMELVDRDKTKKNGADPSATNTSEIDRPRRTYAIKSIRKIMSSSCRIHVNVFVRNYIVRGVFFLFSRRLLILRENSVDFFRICTMMVLFSIQLLCDSSLAFALELWWILKSDTHSDEIYCARKIFRCTRNNGTITKRIFHTSTANNLIFLPTIIHFEQRYLWKRTNVTAR